jgi:hypothetical protein
LRPQDGKVVYLSYVFTEHETIMLANGLNSAGAVEAAIEVVRAFVKLRELLSTHKELKEVRRENLSLPCFFFSQEVEKVAIDTLPYSLFDPFTSTEANSSSVYSSVQPVRKGSNCNRTHAKLLGHYPSRLPAALIKFPAIRHAIHLYHFQSEQLYIGSTLHTFCPS